jgi:hypothetical protein
MKSREGGKERPAWKDDVAGSVARSPRLGPPLRSPAARPNSRPWQRSASCSLAGAAACIVQ